MALLLSVPFLMPGRPAAAADWEFGGMLLDGPRFLFSEWPLGDFYDPACGVVRGIFSIRGLVKCFPKNPRVCLFSWPGRAFGNAAKSGTRSPTGGLEVTRE